MTTGMKFDQDKPEYGLLPPKALLETVKVLTFGAKKYARDNWRFVEEGERRYFDALQRHLWAWKAGEVLDKESGLPHLAHAMCCLMFLYETSVEPEWTSIAAQVAGNTTQRMRDAIFKLDNAA